MVNTHSLKLHKVRIGHLTIYKKCSFPEKVHHINAYILHDICTSDQIELLF